MKETVSELLSYDPIIGDFQWKKGRSFTAYVGTKAGSFHNGYIRIKVLGKEHLAHRLAWLLTYGEFPLQQIDHINGNKSDNRIVNLRLATPLQQRANSKLNCDSTSGFRGVYFNKRRGKWRAHIQRQHLGYFETKEEAAAVYSLEFDKRFGAEFRRPA